MDHSIPLTSSPAQFRENGGNSLSAKNKMDTAQQSQGPSAKSSSSLSSLPDYHTSEPESLVPAQNGAQSRDNDGHSSRIRTRVLSLPYSPAPSTTYKDQYPFYQRSPRSSQLSGLLPEFGSTAGDYYLGADREPIPYPRTIPMRPRRTWPDGEPCKIDTPPRSNSHIDEVPERLCIFMDEEEQQWPTSPRRTTLVPGGDLLRRRKDAARPRVYEYERGDAGRYVASIEDAGRRRAALRAFVRATYPPADYWHGRHPFYNPVEVGTFYGNYGQWLREEVFEGPLPEDDEDYDMAADPGRRICLREPVVGDEGIPDAEMLRRVLAFRAEYHEDDMNTTVRPTAAPTPTKSTNCNGKPSGRDGDDKSPDENIAAIPWPIFRRKLFEKSIGREYASDLEKSRNLGPGVELLFASCSRKRTHMQYAADGDDSDSKDDDDRSDAMSSPPPPPTTVKRIRLIKRATSSTPAVDPAVAGAHASEIHPPPNTPIVNAAETSTGTAADVVPPALAATSSVSMSATVTFTTPSPVGTASPADEEHTGGDDGQKLETMATAAVETVKGGKQKRCGRRGSKRKTTTEDDSDVDFTPEQSTRENKGDKLAKTRITRSLRGVRGSSRSRGSSRGRAPAGVTKARGRGGSRGGLASASVTKATAKKQKQKQSQPKKKAAAGVGYDGALDLETDDDVDVYGGVDNDESML